MGLSVTICTLFAGLAAFAGGTISRFAVPRFVRWVNLLGGVCILTLFFSIVSPNDGFQQELIRPPTPSVRLCAHLRVAPRRSPVNLSINAIVEAEDPIRVPNISRSLVSDQTLELDTHFHAPIPIHFRQLLHDLLAIASPYVLKPSDSQAHLTQARKDRFLPIVNGDANGIYPVRARARYPITPESCFKSTMRSFRTLDVKRSNALSGSSCMNAAIS
jgi:hypothetical protein